MRIDLFGREIEILSRGDDWVVFDLGNEGKKRLASDIVIPASIGKKELVAYLSDIYHENARPKYDSVEIISK